MDDSKQTVKSLMTEELTICNEICTPPPLLTDLVSSFSVIFDWQKVVVRRQERLNYKKVEMLCLTFGSHFSYVACVK